MSTPHTPWELSLIQQIPISIHVYHLDDLNDERSLRMVMVNAASERMLGRSSAELVGKMVDECFPPVAIEYLAPHMAQLARSESASSEVRTVDFAGMKLQIELAALPDHHVAVFFQDIIKQHQASTELAESHRREHMLVALLEGAPDGIMLAPVDISKDSSANFSNAAYRRMLGYDQAIGDVSVEVAFDEPLERLLEITNIVETEGLWQGLMHYRRKDGSTFPALLSAFMIYDDEQRPIARGGIVRDMTEQQRAEQERAMLQEQIIAAQQASLRELSTPLIPMADGIMVMPLIGSIDSARVQQIIETLLDGVSTLQARVAIIDITGVRVVDTQVADGLLRAASAAMLLGAEVMLTGIGPEIAQTLIGLGVDMQRIQTFSSLQRGMAVALSHIK